MKRTAIAALLIAVVLLAAGCTRTVTVTGKFRDIFGLYFVCDGSGSLFGHELNPCRKGHIWRVTRAEYEQARVGVTYTI